ncbi:MAG: lipopolysaccharide transport periplasmic protein LptA [Chromatocurvus sp.]
MIQHSTLATGALLGLLGLLATSALAIQDDTEQPIHIVTHEVIRDETTGVTLYRGDVRLRQGTIRIAADELRLGEKGSGPFSSRNGDPFFKIVATGQPARLQQQLTVDGDITYARANVVEYLRAQSLIRMQDDAHVEQGNTLMRGGVFEYLITQQQIRAYADAQQRVRSLIPPQRFE